MWACNEIHFTMQTYHHHVPFWGFKLTAFFFIMINLKTILFKPPTKNNQPVVEDKLYITDIDDCWVKWYISKLLFRPVLLKENSGGPHFVFTQSWNYWLIDIKFTEYSVIRCIIYSCQKKNRFYGINDCYHGEPLIETGYLIANWMCGHLIASFTWFWEIKRWIELSL